VEVLGRLGYSDLTMDDVAATAGVSKATIYRRWRSKADLIVSVVDAASDLSLVVEDTGSLRDDLVVLLSSLAEVLAGPGGNASRALLGAIHYEPALGEAFRRGPMERWAEAFRTVFARATARGEVAAEAIGSLAAEAGPAVFLQRWMIGDRPIDADLAAAVVDQLIMPHLPRSGSIRSPG
jgi:AcrR family transcriptional regulator